MAHFLGTVVALRDAPRTPACTSILVTLGSLARPTWFAGRMQPGPPVITFPVRLGPARLGAGSGRTKHLQSTEPGRGERR
jgi:hypothetical protein